MAKFSREKLFLIRLQLSYNGILPSPWDLHPDPSRQPSRQLHGGDCDERDRCNSSHQHYP